MRDLAPGLTGSSPSRLNLYGLRKSLVNNYHLMHTTIATYSLGMDWLNSNKNQLTKWVFIIWYIYQLNVKIFILNSVPTHFVNAIDIFNIT